jgi:hypothetical protein
MRLDRRLIGRRNWISDEELQRKLDELPDVSDKIAAEDDSSAETAEAAADAPPAVEPLEPTLS